MLALSKIRRLHAETNKLQAENAAMRADRDAALELLEHRRFRYLSNSTGGFIQVEDEEVSELINKIKGDGL
jgi:hypothetical protein